MGIIENIENTDPEKIKESYINLVRNYLNPAYGAMSKRDFDISLFIEFQKLGVIARVPNLYELITELRVTRQKARNLLYEANLRQTTGIDLDKELEEHLRKPIFLRDNEKVSIEISNPLLIDHLKSKLRELHHITDGSYSPELVKLTTDAYLAIFGYYLPNERIVNIKNAFQQIGLNTNNGFKALLSGIISNAGKKLAGDAGAAFFGPLATSGFDIVIDAYRNLTDNN